MNPFVLDSSIALTWCFKDEETAETQRVLDLAIESQMYVPALWHFELTNILGLGLRRDRISEEGLLEAIQRIKALDLLVDEYSFPAYSRSILLLMRQHPLTGYDAAYLELAIRRQLPLATLDKQLAQAARREGVKLICQAS